MEDLKYLNPTELLEKIYDTLCSEYEDEAHYDNEKDKQEIEVTKKRLTKKVFNEFVVDDEYFLTMDSKTFKERYHLYEKDLLKMITGCSENGVPYEKFIRIIDDLLASANHRLNAFEQLNEEITRIKAEKVEEDVEPVEVIEEEETEEEEA
jgi:DNA-directed RNA polymerase beta subunit